MSLGVFLLESSGYFPMLFFFVRCYNDSSCSPNMEMSRLWAVRDIAADCAVCMDAPASDARRKGIVDFTVIAAISSWAVNRALSDDWLIDKCLEQLELMEREKLPVENIRQYYAALFALMYSYIGLGDTKRASQDIRPLSLGLAPFRAGEVSSVACFVGLPFSSAFDGLLDAREKGNSKVLFGVGVVGKAVEDCNCCDVVNN
ncbi:hypothetical protein GGX14DRAFT_565094 [Mycena pura]|uniref:Uncharacterized protein n=1 Tax=Mycena pura TaxID=153505 RepID=A0AAD6VFI6_9AGAR|nr:hypothetical protein GGX14DRAFT_565094 [Mycena pura]